MANRYRVIHSHKIQGGPYLQQIGWPPKSQDTGWSIATAIMNGYRVTGDHFFGPTFLDPRFILTYILGTLILLDLTFFWTNFFSDLNFVGSKICLDPKLFGLKNMLDQHFHPYQIFGTKLFSDPSLFRPNIWFDQQNFCTQTKIFWPEMLLGESKENSSVALLSSTCLYYFLVRKIKNIRFFEFNGVWFFIKIVDIGFSYPFIAFQIYRSLWKLEI